MGELQSNYAADENEYIPAVITLTDVSGTHVVDSVGVRLKKLELLASGRQESFKIDFNKFISGQNYDGLEAQLQQRVQRSHLHARKVVFRRLPRMVCLHLEPVLPTSPSMEAWGFYTVVEQIDDQFLDWAIEEDSGNLFKQGDNFGGGGPGGGGGGNNTAADLVDYGTDPAVYADRYELKTNEDVNDWSDLVSFIDFINNTDLDAFAAGDDFRMDADGF